MIHQHVGWGSYSPIQNLEAPKKESDILNITGYSFWLIKSNQPKNHWFPLIRPYLHLISGGYLGGGRLTIAINSWKDCCVLVPENMFDNCWVGISLNMFELYWHVCLLWQACVLDMRTMRRNSRWCFQIFLCFYPNGLKLPPRTVCLQGTDRSWTRTSRFETGSDLENKKKVGFNVSTPVKLT